jgi:cytochrome P450
LPSLCRTLTEPANIGGQPIDAGQRVQLNWIAANHDPAEFGDPETIRFDRFPNRHFSFGAGPHRCMGAHLARLELKILIEEVLSAMPDYRVVEEGVRRCSGITRGITALPVTFTPAAISAGPQDGFTR